MRQKPKTRKKPAPSLAKLKKTAWGLLSECVRREASEYYDSDYLGCYTCGAVKLWNDGMQAGHAIGGRDGAVLLDEEIIRPQCVRCNIMLHGNYGIFATKLIIENGMDWWEKKLSDSRQVRKWNRGELEAKCEEYKARLARIAF